MRSFSLTTPYKNNGLSLRIYFLRRSLHEAAWRKKFNLMLYLWRVIIYLFDYFVNYLSIELLIPLHDFPLTLFMT